MAASLDQIIEKRIKRIKANSLTKTQPNGGTFWAINRSQKDVFLDAKGLRDYQSLIRFICEQPHPTLQLPLQQIHGIKAITKIMNDFLRLKTPNFTHLIHHLYPKRIPEWHIYIRLKNITLVDTIVTVLGIVHPPGLPKAKELSAVKKSMKAYLDFPFIEIRSVKAKNEIVAHQAAVDLAKVILSQVENRNSSLVHNKNVDLDKFYISHKISDGTTQFSSSISHRGISYSKRQFEKRYESNLINYLAAVAKSKASPELFNLIKRSCITFQNSKTI